MAGSMVRRDPVGAGGEISIGEMTRALLRVPSALKRAWPPRNEAYSRFPGATRERVFFCISRAELTDGPRKSNAGNCSGGVGPAFWSKSNAPKCIQNKLIDQNKMFRFILTVTFSYALLSNGPNHLDQTSHIPRASRTHPGAKREARPSLSRPARPHGTRGATLPGTAARSLHLVPDVQAADTPPSRAPPRSPPAARPPSCTAHATRPRAGQAATQPPGRTQPGNKGRAPPGSGPAPPRRVASPYDALRHAATPQARTPPAARRQWRGRTLPVASGQAASRHATSRQCPGRPPRGRPPTRRTPPGTRAARPHDGTPGRQDARREAARRQDARRDASTHAAVTTVRTTPDAGRQGSK
jgi:hypothetical protein